MQSATEVGMKPGADKACRQRLSGCLYCFDQTKGPKMRVDDRVNARSTIITSQLPVDHWHAWLNDPALADAILDRLVHASHRIALKGESLRKKTRRNCLDRFYRDRLR